MGQGLWQCNPSSCSSCHIRSSAVSLHFSFSALVLVVCFWECVVRSAHTATVCVFVFFFLFREGKAKIYARSVSHESRRVTAGDDGLDLESIDGRPAREKKACSFVPCPKIFLLRF